MHAKALRAVADRVLRDSSQFCRAEAVPGKSASGLTFGTVSCVALHAYLDASEDGPARDRDDPERMKQMVLKHLGLDMQQAQVLFSPSPTVDALRDSFSPALNDWMASDEDVRRWDSLWRMPGGEYLEQPEVQARAMAELLRTLAAAAD